MNRIVEDRIGEEIFFERLDSGLQIAVSRKPGFVKSVGLFATRYGSVDREFRESSEGKLYKAPDGVAHFLEHKLFEGDKIKVFDRYAELGAYCNAGTSFSTTAYHFSTSGEFAKGFGILLDFVQHPRLTKERVEKEKGIIEQEVRMYEDDPGWKGFFNLLQALYSNHPIRIPIGGTVESVYSITLQDLETCYRSFYRPENMCLVAVGDLDPEKIMDQAAQLVEKREGRTAERIEVEESPRIREKRVETKMSVSRPRVLMGYRDFSQIGSGEEWLARELAMQILLELLFGQSSSVYLDLYSRGVIDESFDASFAGDFDFGFTVLGGETNDPERFLSELQAAIGRAQKEGFSQEDFLRLRRKIFGGALRRYDSPETISQVIMGELFHELRPFAWIDILEKMDLSQVERRLREHFVEGAKSVSLVLPTK